MARTPLFGIVQEVLREALFVSKNPGLESAVREWKSGLESGSAVDRRRFLKTIGATGAAVSALTPAATLLRSTRAVASGKNDWVTSWGSSDDVIILGGGFAGLTAAYRLARAGIRSSVYEGAPRLGGRILTQDRFNAEGMFCELGGELIDTEQLEILGLAAELGVEIDDFIPIDANIERGHFHFGGRNYHTKDILQAFLPLAAHLQRDIALLTDPASGEERVTYRHHTPDAVRLDRMSMKEYLYTKADVDQWVLDLVNVAYLGEYGEETERQSAINLLLMLSPDLSRGFRIFGSSDESKRIRGGNSRLVEALEREYRRNRGEVHLGHELVKIEDKNRRIRLTFKDGNRTVVRSARRVICTIPFSLLRGIDGIATLGLSRVKLRTIRELSYGRNTKHMIGFRERSWRKPQGTRPAVNGYFFTDLPNQCFWDTSRAQAGQSGILTNFLGGIAATNPALHTLQAAFRDLDAVFPGVSSLHDGNESLFRWGDYRFSKGSYTCPSPGQYTTLIGSPAEDELDGRLIFAGEHVSENYQGYMNGAVQSGNSAAGKILSACSTRPESTTAAGATASS